MTGTAQATDDGDDLFDGLRSVVELRQEADRREATLVRRARTEGLTWAEIATVLGVSRQAVHKKYGGSRRERRSA